MSSKQVGPARPVGSSLPSNGPDATALSVPIGARALDLLEIAYRARRPVLLEGPTGIGKSQIAAALAARLGIGYQVLDLSLLEPPDLVGLPVIEHGRTRYASPSELPDGGHGILMLEELNRAEIPVMQPALQLLSARRLHGYELPPGWSCIAAINPEDGDYQVHRLDPALRSRFLQLTVCADRSQWLAWATQADVHAAVLHVVSTHLDVFESASPRSWAYASDVLHALRDAERADAELVRVALRGYLPTSWAMVLADALRAEPTCVDFDVEQILDPKRASSLATVVKQLERDRRADAIAALASRIRHVLGSARLLESVCDDRTTLVDLETRLAPLPGDLREQCLDAAVRSPAAAALLEGLGHDLDRALEAYEPSSLRTDILAWRERMHVHRVRLVSCATARWLERVKSDASRARAVRPSVLLLHTDLGSLGGELDRWLRAAGWLERTR